MFSPVRLLIQKLYLASDEAFKRTSCIAPQTYLQAVQIWRVRWPLFLQNHLQIIRVQALLSDIVLCAQSPMHLAESAVPSGSSRLQYVINFRSQY